MIWFFWIFTSFVFAYTAFTASTVDGSSHYLAATRTLRCFALSFIYLMYGSIAISMPDEFGIDVNTDVWTLLHISTIVSVFMIVFWLSLFIGYRTRCEGELQVTVDNLKRLKWREAKFDRKAFIAEWKNLFRPN